MTAEAIAEHLLIPLWRGIAKAYKMKYARTIWLQFENGIKSAASTSNVGSFLNSFCERMQCDLLADDVTGTAQFVQTCDGRKLLKSLREETTLLVMLVRVANEQRKEEWKTEQEQNGDV